jgi:hypothetical protein
VTRPVRVGQLRPSQLLHTFGIGSVVDLPHISALVQGLDDWDTTEAATVNEPRLLAQVRARLGQQVTALRLPPYAGDDGDHPFADTDTAVGVPVAAFPRWLRCPRCTYLGPISSGLFSLKREPYRPDRVRYEHPCTTQGRPPTAQPVRFLVACRNGHLDDFPWELYAHRGPPCDEPLLELQERGIAGEASNVFVRCRHCDESRSMVQAFGQSGQRTMPYCRGRHPHLAAFFSCDQQVRTILLGASNLWFADAISVLSIPEYQAPLPQKVADLRTSSGPSPAPTCCPTPAPPSHGLPPWPTTPTPRSCKPSTPTATAPPTPRNSATSAPTNGQPSPTPTVRPPATTSDCAPAPRHSPAAADWTRSCWPTGSVKSSP